MRMKLQKRKGFSRKLLNIFMAAFVALGSYTVIFPVATSAVSQKPKSSLPRVSPTPQMMKSVGADLTIPKKVLLIAGNKADQAAVDLVKKTFQNYGIKVKDGNGNPGQHKGNVKVYVGGPSETPESADVLKELGRKGPDELSKEGYVLAIERKVGTRIVLSGKDHAGTYYAAQTLRQLFQKKGGSVRLPSVYIQDFPSTSFRGGEESFYGPVWSWADRYDQVDFLSAHKMNYFFYGPAGDDHTTGRGWRNLYTHEELKKFQHLVDYAHAHHVKFLYRIGSEAPQVGNSAPGICHAKKSDRDALVNRFEQMYDIGVRKFVLSWDDVTGKFSCEEDNKRYGSGDVALATAQAEVLNYVQKHFFDAHPDVERGMTIPSQYWGNESNQYRSTFDKLTTIKMDIYWTGPQVVSGEIKKSDILKAKKAFPNHRIVIFDNYPVNDYNRNRLNLGPLDNRGVDLLKHTAGISWNEMNEERASHIPLFTEAEYAWNPSAYDPEMAWDAALHEIGGNAYSALKAFADVNRTDGFLGDTQASYLGELIDAVKKEYRTGKDLSGAFKLESYLDELAVAPDNLRNKMPDFAENVEPWLDKMDVTVSAANDALTLLKAMANQDWDSAKAARHSLEKSQKAMHDNPKEVAVGVVDPFIKFATTEYDRLQERYISMSVPYGLRVFPRGGTATVATTLTASAPGTVKGTLTITAPEGWSVEKPTQKVALRSNGRTATATFKTKVTLAKNASEGDIKFKIQTTDGRTVTASTHGVPVTASNLTYRNLVMSDNPNGYWRLDDVGDKLIDSSGNGQDGVYHSGVTQNVSGATSDGNDAVQFNGGYAEVPSSSLVSPTGPFTVEAWIKPDIIAGGPGMGIVEKYTTPGRSGFLIRLDGTNRLTAYTQSKTTDRGVTGGPSIGTGTWHHVAAVFDGSSLAIYLDGMEVNRVEDHLTPDAGPASMKIGARGDDAARRFVGGIDEVALYPKALSTEKIEQHFLAGLGATSTDKMPPEIQTKMNGKVMQKGATIPDSKTAKFTWNAKDKGSGVAKVTATFDDKTYKEDTAVNLAGEPGEHELVVTAVDKAGNVKEKSYAIHVTTSAQDMMKLVSRYGKEGGIKDHKTAHALNLQLITVDHFAKKDLAEKVEKHLKGLELLVNHQKKHNLITDKVYNVFMADADYLTKKWQ